jgi:hypothetical protein
MDAQFVVLQKDVAHIRADIAEMKIDLRIAQRTANLDSGRTSLDIWITLGFFANLLTIAALFGLGRALELL